MVPSCHTSGVLRLTKPLFCAGAALLLYCAPQQALAANRSVTWTTQDDFERNAATTSVITTRTFLDTASASGDLKIGLPRDIVTTATFNQLTANNKIYSTGTDRNSLAVLDAESNTLVKSIALPGKPSGAVFNSVNNKLYVGVSNDNKVVVIDCATDTVSATLTLGNKVYAALYNPVRNKVYVANTEDQTVSVLDGATDAVLATIPVTAGAYSAYLNQAGTRVYFTSKLNQYVVVVNAESDQVVKSVEIDPSTSLLGGNATGNVGLQSLSGIPADKLRLSWNNEPLQPGQKILFQVRTAADAASLGGASYLGPDGTGDSWYQAGTSGVIAQTENDASVTDSIDLPVPYAPATEIQVKLVSDGIATPVLHSVTLEYLTYPDLVVSAVSGPSVGVIGSNIQISTALANQGGEPAGPFKVALSLYNTATGTLIPLGERSVQGLAAGGSDSGSTTVSLASVPAGSYTMKACADSADTVLEGIENNNCTLGNAISIVTPPDLVVTYTAGPHTTYCSEDEVPVCNDIYANPMQLGTSYNQWTPANFTNQGGYQAGPFKVTMYLTNGTNQYLYAQQTVPSLAAGASSGVSLTSTVPWIPVGTYTFKTCIDTDNQVAEGDETNNCTFGTTVNVVGVDLIANSALINPLGTPPSSLAIGSSPVIHLSVANIGGGSVPAGTVEAIYFHNNATGVDYFFASKATRALSSMQSDMSLANHVTGTISSAIPPGNYTLKACADITNVLRETDETNNCFYGLTLNLY